MFAWQIGIYPNSRLWSVYFIIFHGQTGLLLTNLSSNFQTLKFSWGQLLQSKLWQKIISSVILGIRNLNLYPFEYIAAEVALNYPAITVIQSWSSQENISLFC